MCAPLGLCIYTVVTEPVWHMIYKMWCDYDTPLITVSLLCNAICALPQMQTGITSTQVQAPWRRYVHAAKTHSSIILWSAAEVKCTVTAMQTQGRTYSHLPPPIAHPLQTYCSTSPWCNAGRPLPSPARFPPSFPYTPSIGSFYWWLPSASAGTALTHTVSHILFTNTIPGESSCSFLPHHLDLLWGEGGNAVSLFFFPLLWQQESRQKGLKGHCIFWGGEWSTNAGRHCCKERLASEFVRGVMRWHEDGHGLLQTPVICTACSCDRALTASCSAVATRCWKLQKMHVWELKDVLVCFCTAFLHTVSMREAEYAPGCYLRWLFPLEIMSVWFFEVRLRKQMDVHTVR